RGARWVSGEVPSRFGSVGTLPDGRVSDCTLPDGRVSDCTLPDGRVSVAPHVRSGPGYDALAASRITKSKVPGETFRKRLLRLSETAILMVGLLPVKLKPPSISRL